MTIINDNATLSKYIPNVVTAVEGEDNLFTKIHVHLLLAERWFFGNVCKEAALTEELMPLARTVVAAEAFRNAIPSLNVILTANGFGIVSNTSVAPASKERTADLAEALVAQRDNAIEQIVMELQAVGTLFAGLLFRGFEAQRMQGITTNLFDKFREQRLKLFVIQDTIADEVISTEVLDEMRAAVYTDEAVRPIKLNFLFAAVPGIIIKKLKGEECREDVKRVVQFIRIHPDDFPNWSESEAAKHWADYTFQNKKSSGGFWL